jgi:hypothetical protein
MMHTKKLSLSLCVLVSTCAACAPTIPDAKTSEAIRDAVVEARKVINSKSFQDHLLAIPHLDASATIANLTTGTEVARLYLESDGITHQYPTTYLVTRCGCGSSTASTGIDGPNKKATTTLRSCTLERMAALPKTNDDPVEGFACAINTIAHEWTHSIPEPNDPGVWLYQDNGHANAREWLVSYTVGAIAQCVYLDARGFRVEEKFEECLKAVGTTLFSAKTCEDGWAETMFGRRPAAPVNK